MNTLDNLGLDFSYSSSRTDTVKDFYIPVLSAATRYDRVTGYFSPKVLALAARGFSQLIKNGGKVRLITSVAVNDETLRALSEGNYDEPSPLNQFAKSFDTETLHGQLENDYYNTLVYLLNAGRIEIRIAAVNSGAGIVHEKSGVVYDTEGNKVAFIGSNNETVFGWSQNIEKFIAFRSWEQGDNKFITNIANDFEAYWNNDVPGVEIMDIDQARLRDVLRPTSQEDIDQIIRRIEDAEDPVQTTEDAPLLEGNKELFPYQLAAVDSWVNNGYRGILEMATGTGKTLTGLAAVKSLYRDKKELFCVVVVPLTHLIDQWMEDIEVEFPEARILRAGGDYPDWRRRLPGLVRSYHNGLSKQVIIITTYKTFIDTDFNEALSTLNSDYCLLADEVHNAKTERVMKSIDKYEYRLGLSATPRSKWDDGTTDKLLGLFSGICFSYSLSEAIENDFLVRFRYFPKIVHLNSDELSAYNELSVKISRIINIEDDSYESALTALLNQRASIVKNAEQKTGALEDLIMKLKANELFDHVLVYCDNQDQIADAQRIIDSFGMASSRITFKEGNELRKKSMSEFDFGYVDALVARKCLDEGVNIPSTRVAILVASNTDSREYIQRLGRVLRKYPEKKYAIVYDFLVLPDTSAPESERSNLVKNEMERFNFFCENAHNREELTDYKKQVLSRYVGDMENQV